MTVLSKSPNQDWVKYEKQNQDKRGLELLHMNFREHVDRILAFAPKDHNIHWQVQQISDQYGDYLEKREKTAENSRLSGLRQHALKCNRDPVGSVFPITRFYHSRMVAVNAMFFALCAGRSISEAVESIEGGWRHDCDHPAYCHTAEHLIVNPPYLVDTHDERSLISTLNDVELVKFTLKNNLKLGNIVSTMRERGRFLTQSVADTAGYLEHDGQFIGNPVSEDFIWRIAFSLKGAESSRLVVDDTEAIMELLQKRAEYFKMCYASYKGRLCDSATRLLLRFGIEEKCFTPQDLILKTDKFIDDRFLAMLNKECEVPDWVYSLLNVARGDLQELSENWEEHKFDNARAYEAKRKELEDWRKDIMAMPTRNLASKTIKVVSSYGMERVLKAEIDTDLADRTWFLYTFKQKS